MTSEERTLILDLCLERISESEFLARFPVNPRTEPGYITHELQNALQTRDAAAVECATLLGFRYGFSSESAGILCELILADWHNQHENIAMALQQLRDPATVDCLYEAASMTFAYLDYDESHALAVKCIWALSAINTALAIERLRLLAQSGNPIIRENARRRLLSLDRSGDARLR
jgi:hypothetical protein